MTAAARKRAAGAKRTGRNPQNVGVPLEFRLLGPVEAVRDGHAIDLGGPKQRAVLAVLLLDAGRVVATDRIVASVWGEDAPPSALAGLHAYLSNLRKALRDKPSDTGPILRRPPGYLLAVDPEQVDLGRFRSGAEQAQAALDAADWPTAVTHAETALGLIRGPLAAEFADQEWVRVAAAALEERRVGGTQTLITGLLGSGRIPAALTLAAELAAAQPLSENACRLLMLATYRAGRPAEALQTYRRFRDRLDDDLGLDPTASLRGLHAAMLRQEPWLTTWPVDPAAAHAGPRPSRPVEPAAPSTQVDAPQSDLVGREPELVVISDTLRAAREDGPRWILLTGVAGIGKTRLAEEAVALWLASGGQVLRARCPDEEGLPAYWPIRALLAEQGNADPDEVLAPPADAPADEARFAVYDQILAVVTQGCDRQPLLVLVDDVQWADPATLRFLRFVAETGRRLPLAIVVTVRDQVSSPELERLAEAVGRSAGSRHVPLPPLTVDQVGTLAGRFGPSLSAEDVRQLADRTEGNPFFVSQYAQLPASDRREGQVPVAVRSVLRRRLANLEPQVLQVLRTAAVLGDVPDLDLLVQVTGLDPDALDDALDSALHAAILVADRGHGGYGFAHALLRDELLDGLSAPRRQRIHLRIAQAVGPDASGGRLATRAGHLMAALPFGSAAEALEAAGRLAIEAEAAWQFESAAYWWENAGKAWDLAAAQDPRPRSERDDLTVAQLAALAHTGRSQTVVDLIDAGLLEAIRQGRTGFAGRLAAALLRATGSWPWSAYGMDPGRLLPRLAGVEGLVREDTAAHVRILATLAVGCTYDPDESVPDSLSKRALELAEELGDPDVLADALIGRVLSRAGVAAVAHDLARWARRLSELPHRQSRSDQVLAHNVLTMTSMLSGQMDAATEHIRHGAVGADLLRLAITRVQLRWADGAISLWRGQFDRAEETFAHAFAMHRQTELAQADLALQMAVMCVRWIQGRVDEIEWDPTLRDNPAWIALFRASIDPRPEAERLVRAEAVREEAGSWLGLARLVLIGHAVADLGLTDLAALMRRRLHPHQHQVAIVGQIGGISSAAVTLARLAALDGDDIAARAHLAAATDLAVRSGGRPELIRCRLLALELDGAGPQAWAELVADAQELGMGAVVAAAHARVWA